LDRAIEVMHNHDDIIEIMLRREGPIDKRQNPRNVVVDGLELIQFDTMSVATGLFNTSLVGQVLDNHGWDDQVHEVGTLTPITEEMGLKKFILGQSEIHYQHVGEQKGYRKGAWRK